MIQSVKCRGEREGARLGRPGPLRAPAVMATVAVLVNRRRWPELRCARLVPCSWFTRERGPGVRGVKQPDACPPAPHQLLLPLDAISGSFHGFPVTLC